MPAKRILDALGMTVSQWGALPPETGEGKTDDRPKLRAKALQIIADNEHREAQANIRDRGEHGGLIPRLENIEASIRGVASDAERRIVACETRLATMERGYSALEKESGLLDKKVEELKQHVAKLEKK